MLLLWIVFMDCFYLFITDWELNDDNMMERNHKKKFKNKTVRLKYLLYVMNK